MFQLLFHCFCLLFLFDNSQIDISRKQVKKYSSKIHPSEIGDVYQKSSPVKILDYSLEKNILSLNVEFEGGCDEHDFKLIGNHMISKSLPPRRLVSLIHMKNNDECNQLQTEMLKFDLSNLAEKGSEINKIYLDFLNTKISLLYSKQ